MDILNRMLNVGRVNEKSNTWDVFLDGKKIDTINDASSDPVDVKNSLVNHDGYDPGIVVRMRKPKNEGKVALDSDKESVKIRKLTEQDDVSDEDSTSDPKEPPIEKDGEDEGAPDDSTDKEYVGKTEDTHYYMVTNAGAEGDEPGELQIVDQDGTIKFSSKDANIEALDPTEFLIRAIEEVEMDEITRSVFTKYILPRLEEEEEEENLDDEESLEGEDEETAGMTGDDLKPDKKVAGSTEGFMERKVNENEVLYAELDQVIKDNEGSESPLRLKIQGDKTQTKFVNISQEVARKIASILGKKNESRVNEVTQKEYNRLKAEKDKAYKESGRAIAKFNKAAKAFRKAEKEGVEDDVKEYTTKNAGRKLVEKRGELVSAEFGPGKYFFGDICYAMNDDVYHGHWGEKCDFEDGEFDVDGVKFAVAGTAYGDGSFVGSDGKEYGVDAGVIGIVPESMWKSEESELSSSGTVITVKDKLTFEAEDGVFNVNWEGNNIEVNTKDDTDDDGYEEDDYDDTDEGKVALDKDSESTKIKKLIEKTITYDGKDYEVSLVDDGTLDTVIDINGHEQRFGEEFASMWRDEETGELSEEGLEELALDALSSMEPEELEELEGGESSEVDIAQDDDGKWFVTDPEGSAIAGPFESEDEARAEAEKEWDKLLKDVPEPDYLDAAIEDERRRRKGKGEQKNESKVNGHVTKTEVDEKKKLPDALKKHMFKKGKKGKKMSKKNDKGVAKVNENNICASKDKPGITDKEPHQPCESKKVIPTISDSEIKESCNRGVGLLKKLLS